MTVPPRSLHSWWLCPPAAPAALLTSAIDAAAAAHGAPRFPPHVTLAGAFACTDDDAAAGGRALAARLAPCTRVTFDGVATGATYHKRAFLTAVRSGPLCEAGKAAAALADAVSGGGAAGGRFEPHASLLYSDDAGAAAAVAADAANIDLAAAGWTGGRVEVWRTEGPVETWAAIASYDLAG